MGLLKMTDIIDKTLFLYLGISVIYLFIFAVFSRFKRTDRYPQSKVYHRVLVLFPAYREDNVIESSLRSFLAQEYPRESYEVMVISDQMEEVTNQQLEKLPIRLIRANYENSSKAKALNLAIDSLKNEHYDIVVIMDADNIVEHNFLQEINNAYHSGVMAMQAHRKAKNTDTDMAILDAASEEMNNAYFRKGHVFAGLSSALSGSGMAFDYSWFCENIKMISSSGEDKELEVLLLKQRIYIDYLDHVVVLDEKIKSSAAFYKQRQRWLAAQFGSLKKAVSDLPSAIFSGNLDYTNKLLQWMMLPRLLLLGFITILCITMLFIKIEWAIKWWGLLFLLFITFGLAIPRELDNKRLEKAVRKIPWLFVLMFINLFKLKGANKKFVHTEHN